VHHCALECTKERLKLTPELTPESCTIYGAIGQSGLPEVHPANRVPLDGFVGVAPGDAHRALERQQCFVNCAGEAERSIASQGAESARPVWKSG
jgi:hypothetical protein